MTDDRARVEGERMSLAVALSFATEPRRHDTLEAPADSVDELYEALAVLAAALARTPEPSTALDTMTRAAAILAGMLDQPLVAMAWEILREGAAREGESVAEIVGYQYALDPCRVTKEKRWVFALYPTEHEAHIQGDRDGKIAPVRPLYITSASAAVLAEREALKDIAAERQRQIDAEGWTPEHDDEHTDGALAKAAICYASVYPLAGSYWPWSINWWKPKDRRSNLIRAAALIVAEIERLDRARSISEEG